jgi:hypothetical protein
MFTYGGGARCRKNSNRCKIGLIGHREFPSKAIALRGARFHRAAETRCVAHEFIVREWLMAPIDLRGARFWRAGKARHGAHLRPSIAFESVAPLLPASRRPQGPELRQSGVGVA